MKPASELADGLESYSISGVLFGNLVFWIQVLLGSVASWLVWRWLTAIYLAYAIVGWLALRRSVCSRCYYRGKRCCMGWGLLLGSSKQDEHWRSFPDSAGIRLAPFFYGGLSFVPLALLIYLLVAHFSLVAVVVLAAMVVLGGVGFAMRSANCRRCRMRSICPGAAVKSEAA